jgi:uncharacterized RDD family membrane protein YckC
MLGRAGSPAHTGEMTMDWFYAADQRQVGPLSEAEFARLVRAGTIGAKTLVWRAGMPEWRAWELVSAEAPIPPEPAMSPDPGAADAAAGVETARCSQCGNVHPTAGMLSYAGTWVCAGCKPIFLERLKQGAPVATTVRYGGFWIRFLARFLDGIILGIVGILLVIPFGLGAVTTATGTPGDIAHFLAMQALLLLIRVLLAGTYESVFVARAGATPGKMACRLQVVRPDGSRLTLGRSIGRFFATWVSGITLGIGYIIAAFDDEKRSLHDRICETRVIRA